MMNLGYRLLISRGATKRLGAHFFF